MISRSCFDKSFRVAAAGVLAALAGCAPSGGIRITPVPVDRTLEFRVIARESYWTNEKIAIIDLEGVLENQAQGGFWTEGENPVSLAVEKLDAAAADPTIRAVVLRINSPGGGVTACDILHDEIQRFRETTKKPVVAILMDVAASGGYYVACAAHPILAHRTTITGSIGVIVQIFSVQGLLGRIGVKAQTMRSGPMKGAGAFWQDLSPEQRQVFEGMVEEFHGRFLEVVRTGRPNIPSEKLATIADGRVYTATQALKLGLIDRLGSIRDAVEEAKKQAGLRHANLVIYSRPLGWRPNAYSRVPDQAGPVEWNLLKISGEKPFTTTPRFAYLWELQ